MYIYAKVVFTDFVFFPEFRFLNESPYFKESFYHLTFDSICGSSDKLFKVAFDKTSV